MGRSLGPIRGLALVRMCKHALDVSAYAQRSGWDISLAAASGTLKMQQRTPQDTVGDRETAICSQRRRERGTTEKP